MLKCWSPAKKQIPPQMKNEELLLLPINNNINKIDDISISTSVREFDREGDLLFEGFNFDLMSSAQTSIFSFISSVFFYLLSLKSYYYL
jgi:hypothetical protein